MSNFWFCEIQKSDIPPPRKIEKALVICKFSIENPVIFCHFWGQKYTSKSIDFSISGFIFDEFWIFYPIILMAFLVQFLIFSQKNWFSSQKVQKNWKFKNSVKTALTPLFKELWAIYVFFTNLKFDDCQKHNRKSAKI